MSSESGGSRPSVGQTDGPGPAAAFADPGTDADPMLAVQTQGLAKRFGRQLAVAGIDLSVPRGAVFGFLGPNGSGKTTTIRMLLGLAEPSAGRMWVLGGEVPRALRQVLPQVGALIEGPAFYPYLSGTANLARFDAADIDSDPRTRRERIAGALERVGLSHAGNKKAKAYSLGMRQRLGIATALLSPRELLVLDEPTNGLDPQGTREVRSLIRSLAADGTTVLVSSHLLAEVQQICTHAAIMATGSVVAQGTLDQLRGVTGARMMLVTPDPGAATELLARLGIMASVSPGGESGGLRHGDAGVTVTALWPEPPVAAEDVVGRLVGAGVRVRGFSVAQPSLEERFVALTGEGFDVAQ